MVGHVSLPLPSTLSPSKVSAFKDCALAFRFAAIDRLPEPPSLWTAKGTLVHRALERLFAHIPVGARTVDAALAQLDLARPEVLTGPEYAALGLDGEAEAELAADAAQLVRNYFELEDPNQVNTIGLELTLEARLGTLRLRGIVDRLDVGPDGELIIVDYKTGRAPGIAYEQQKLGGVHFYAYLCEQMLGRRPARVQLLHLREPVVIESIPTDQSIRGLAVRAAAVWAAVERACQFDDFRPKPGRLCDYCAFKAYCPAFGGDPALAVTAGTAGKTALQPVPA
ncbi:MAG: putative RecB family exonuclease [Acidimicrobiaceae bacterium]|nr:putative RecB family exonuclease [Acidimicrobiaceae bacterium]